MIICHCLSISDRTIRAAVRAGACNREQVAKACGAGSCCGGCRPAVDELIEQQRPAPEIVFLSLAPAE